MNILGMFLNQEIRTGGHRRYLSLMEGLAARGHRVVTILNDELECAPSHFESLRIRAPYIHMGFPPVTLRFGQAVLRALPTIRKRARDVDCVLVHGETHLVAGVLLKRALSARLVFGHRSNMFREGTALFLEAKSNPGARAAARRDMVKYRLYERAIAAASDRIVFQSRYDRDDFCSRVRSAEGKATIINNSLGGAGFAQGLSEANRSPALRTIAFVGTYGERKGVRYLIQAARILRDRGLDKLRFKMLRPGRTAISLPGAPRAGKPE